VPVLTDGVVTLRAHRRSDVDAVVEQCNDPETLRWTTVPRPYRKADALRWLAAVREGWEQGGTRRWAVEWTPEGSAEPRYAGTVDLRPGPGRVAAIGFALHPDARGEGLMSRAVRLACSHAFEEGLGDGPVERVHWGAVVGNFASWRVAWAAGFVFHGTIPRMEGPVYPLPDGRVEARDHWVASLAPRAPMVPQTPWLEVPVLEGEGIRLRPWRDEDGDHAEPLAGPSHHMPAGAAPDDLTFDHWLLVRRERSAFGIGIVWCIADAVSDQPLGAMLLFDNPGPMGEVTAELGYFLFPSARGRGAATMGGELAIDHAFAPRSEGGLGLTRLSAQTAADNAASNAVLERLGFLRWGVEHETDRLPNGQYANAFHWELLASTR
jgi:RimJ/RimL family protein N-acetyltransferase